MEKGKLKRKILNSQLSTLNSFGFTLIEILTVITILAVLSGIGMVSFRGVQSKGRDSNRKNDLRQLVVALELYKQSSPTGTYVHTDTAQCNTTNSDAFYSAIAPFMSGNSVSYDPLNQTEKYCYYSENSDKSFRLFAKLENCSDPEVIDTVTCTPTAFNFSKASADLAIALAPTQMPTSTPIPTIGPTSTPTPTSTPMPTSTPVPTSTPTPTPTTQPALAKLVFVTSTTNNKGTLGNLSGANGKCQNLADGVTALLGKTWKAWLSNNTQSPADQFDGDVWIQFNTGPYKTVTGVTVANNWNGLISGTLLAPINIDQNGNSVTGNVWTNTDFNGTRFSSSAHCSNWSSNSGTSYIGDSSSTTATWSHLTSVANCLTGYRLYCFEQ